MLGLDHIFSDKKYTKKEMEIYAEEQVKSNASAIINTILQAIGKPELCNKKINIGELTNLLQSQLK